MIFNILNWIARQAGYAVCHQIPERSLVIGGRALPVCARCTGIFLGFTITFLALAISFGGGGARRLSRVAMVVVGALTLPLLIDAITSYAGIRETTNWVRLATGGLAGAAVAALVFPLAAGQLAKVTAARQEPARPAFAPTLFLVPVSLTLVASASWGGAYGVWAATVVGAVVFTLVVLNLTLTTLVLERVRAMVASPPASVLVAVSMVAVLTELVVFNRLHWLVDRLL